MTPDEIVRVGVIYERIKYLKEGVARKVIGRKTPEKSVNWSELKTFCNSSFDRELLPVYYFMAQYEGKKIPTKPEMRFLNNNIAMLKYANYIKSKKQVYSTDTKSIVTSLQKTKYILELYKLANELESYDDLLMFKTFSGQPFPDLHRIYRLGLISDYLVATSDKLYNTLKETGLLKGNNLHNFKIIIENDQEAYNYYNINFTGV